MNAHPHAAMLRDLFAALPEQCVIKQCSIDGKSIHVEIAPPPPFIVATDGLAAAVEELAASTMSAVNFSTNVGRTSPRPPIRDCPCTACNAARAAMASINKVDDPDTRMAQAFGIDFAPNPDKTVIFSLLPDAADPVTPSACTCGGLANSTSRMWCDWCLEKMENGRFNYGTDQAAPEPPPPPKNLEAYLPEVSMGLHHLAQRMQHTMASGPINTDSIASYSADIGDGVSMQMTVTFRDRQ